MRILIAAHKNPYIDPRGGERSVVMIAEHLRGQGHEEDIFCRKKGSVTPETFDHLIFDMVKHYEIAITWSDAAPKTSEACLKHGIPYILMVRWWKNVQPIPPRRLLTREVDRHFLEVKRPIFENAHEVITNNKWSRDVIKKYFGVDASVSYVPVSESIKKFNTKRDAVAAVTPEKQLGEWKVIDEISKNKKVIAVNASRSHARAESVGYVKDMDELWSRCSAMIYPIYYNDVCGCSRIAFEAMSRGVVPICSDACGFSEWIPDKWLISLEAPIEEWSERIEQLSEKDTEDAFNIFEEYIARQPDQLRVYEKAVERS